MIYPIFIVIISLALILLGSALFTNGIEWVGKHFQLSDSATGSVLAGVGTALPETLIPFIAILLGRGSSGKEVGIGAILGAPFMLSTLTLPLVGFGIYFYSGRGNRSARIQLNFEEIKIDLKYFLISFSFAIAASAIENRLAHYVIGLFLFVLYGFYLRMVFQRPSANHLDLEALYFRKFIKNPGILAIGAQTFSGLAVIIFGASYFIEGIEQTAGFFQISPMILSLLATPIATELPEKFNSLIWIKKKKDHLAFSNITGAMVFQSTFPVSIGLFGTSWRLNHIGTDNIILTLAASLYFFMILVFKRKWEPFHLMAGSLAYLGYLLILFYHR